MDDDLPIPLEGRPVRVHASLIQQAHDTLSLRGGEYITFVVVGAQAVSVFTGKQPRRMITHEAVEEEPTMQMRGGRFSPGMGKAKAKAKAKGTRTRRSGLPNSAIDINALELLDFFQRERNRAISARQVGDELEFPRKNAAQRQTLSRMIAELRVSDLIRATDKSRIPDYQFVEELPNIQGSKSISADTVLAFMRQVDRPLAVGIIGDMFQLSRHDRSKRFLLSVTFSELLRNEQVAVSTDERLKIPVYRLAK